MRCKIYLNGWTRNLFRLSRDYATYSAFYRHGIRKSVQVKLEELIDDSIVRELDKSGYFDRINAEYGVK